MQPFFRAASLPCRLSLRHLPTMAGLSRNASRSLQKEGLSGKDVCDILVADAPKHLLQPCLADPHTGLLSTAPEDLLLAMEPWAMVVQSLQAKSLVWNLLTPEFALGR